MTCILAYHDGTNAWMAADSRVMFTGLDIDTIPGGKVFTVGSSMFASYGDLRMYNLLQARYQEIYDEVMIGVLGDNTGEAIRNPCRIAVYRAVKDYADDWGLSGKETELLPDCGVIVSEPSGAWCIDHNLSILQGGRGFLAGGAYPIATGAWHALAGMRETRDRLLATLRICADLNASVGPPYHVYRNGNLIMKPEE